MILYKFEANWCNPCKQLTRTLTNVNPEIIKLVQVVDIDSDDELIDKYHIRNVPVLVFADDEGNELGRLVGAVNAQTITDKFTELYANN